MEDFFNFDDNFDDNLNIIENFTIEEDLNIDDSFFKNDEELNIENYYTVYNVIFYQDKNITFYNGIDNMSQLPILVTFSNEFDKLFYMKSTLCNFFLKPIIFFKTFSNYVYIYEYSDFFNDFDNLNNLCLTDIVLIKKIIPNLIRFSNYLIQTPNLFVCNINIKNFFYNKTTGKIKFFNLNMLSRVPIPIHHWEINDDTINYISPKLLFILLFETKYHKRIYNKTLKKNEKWAIICIIYYFLTCGLFPFSYYKNTDPLTNYKIFSFYYKFENDINYNSFKTNLKKLYNL